MTSKKVSTEHPLMRWGYGIGPKKTFFFPILSGGCTFDGERTRMIPIGDQVDNDS